MSELYDVEFKGDRKVCTVKDVHPETFIEKFAEHLKRQGKFDVPEWTLYSKNGVHKEYAAYSDDWMYIRAAGIARNIYVRGNVGVGQLRKAYGGQWRRGTRTNARAVASGKVVRHCVQQLQSLGYITEANKGRSITNLGQKEMDTIAAQLN